MSERIDFNEETLLGNVADAVDEKDAVNLRTLRNGTVAKMYRARMKHQESVYVANTITTPNFKPDAMTTVVVEQNTLGASMIQWASIDSYMKNISGRPLVLDVELQVVFWDCPTDIGELTAWWVVNDTEAEIMTSTTASNSVKRYGTASLLNSGTRHGIVTSHTTLYIPNNHYFAPRFVCDRNGFYAGATGTVNAVGIDAEWSTMMQLIDVS